LCVSLAFGLVSLALFAPVPAQAFMPLHMLGVRLSDLRPGYQAVGTGFGCTGYCTASQTAFEYNLSAHHLYSHGWQNAYEASYQSLKGGYRQVSEELTQFSTGKGAAWFYGVSAATRLCCGSTYRRITAPAIGSARTGTIETSMAHTSVGVIFRRGDYVVTLDVYPKTEPSWPL
jgi:hypothetical protein